MNLMIKYAMDKQTKLSSVVRVVIESKHLRFIKSAN